jgi:lipoate-protein ligase A
VIPAWRLLHTEPMSGAGNMGLDEALLYRARATGECVFRVYTWLRPTLSLGRNQQARGRIDPARARDGGVDIVRRPTGGRALLHHHEVTYSVTAPVRREESVRDWHERVNGVLLAAIRSLGVRAEPAMASGRTPTPGSASCFQRPDAGEIVVDGRKLVGSAVLKEGAALLQHGSILLEDDQGLLVDLLPRGEVPPARAATLREALGRVPAVAEVRDALFRAVRAAAGGAGVTPLDAAEDLTRAAERAAARYASDEWTFTR